MTKLLFYDIFSSIFNIFDDEDIRQGLKEYSDWPTYPQLYVKGELIGGCDIVMDLFDKGELQTMVSATAQ